MGVRDAIGQFCDMVVPSDYGSPAFERITGGKFTPGFGSTCGFLVSAVLEAIGCETAIVLNRDGAIDVNGNPTSYVPGANISRFVAGSKALGAWRTLADTPSGPRLGDLCYCSDGVNPHSEHVFVARGDLGSSLPSWDAGKTNAQGQQCARIDDRAFNPSTGTLDFIGGPRKLQGWADVDALPHHPALDDAGSNTAALAILGFGLLLVAGVYTYA